MSGSRAVVSHAGATSCQQHDTEAEQYAEYAPPPDDAGEDPAHDRGDDGRDAIDCAYHGQHFCEVAARELVGGYRARNDYAARPSDALQQAEGDELEYITGHDAHGRR